jgi:hypothetical protein
MGERIAWPSDREDAARAIMKRGGTSSYDLGMTD